MPITFTLHPEAGYYVSKYEDIITDADMIEAFERFFTGPDWTPDMNELADLSDANLTQTTTEGILSLAKMAERIFAERGASPRVAVYAPRDLPYGLARMYSAEAERFETHRVFRDFDEAKSWLTSSQ